MRFLIRIWLNLLDILFYTCIHTYEIEKNYGILLSSIKGSTCLVPLYYLLMYLYSSRG